jgi:hypothetical protein
MGIWLDALVEAAAGNQAAALERVRQELPMALRTFGESEDGARTYGGPVMSAVRRFIAKLPKAEQIQVSRFDCELVDMIVDDVCAAIERSLYLVELCREQPCPSLDELVERFPWAPGLKRDRGWKRQWLADALRSIQAAGVPLPAPALEVLGAEGEPRYGFDEVAYAASPERIKLSWGDFKRDQELDHDFLCIVESDEEPSVANEAVDFRSIRVAEIVLSGRRESDPALLIDLHRIGQALTAELASVLEQMHGGSPVDGYRPVAWHNVFWNVTEEYEGLRLTLEIRDPFLDKDGALADHIRGAYPEVKSCSRPVILRRRQKLYGECIERIHERMQELAEL